jgi:uncharacterized protein (DUF488 family)
MSGPEIFTIGHSNHPIERFIGLLQQATIEMLVDVRSVPASRFCPQFRREPLARALAAAGVGYRWRGDALGGKPRDRTLWRDGAPDYAAIAGQPQFERAIEELVSEARKTRLAIMCAERAPLECHRTLLLGPALERRGAALRHILADGTIAAHRAVLDASACLFAKREQQP